MECSGEVIGRTFEKEVERDKESHAENRKTVGRDAVVGAYRIAGKTINSFPGAPGGRESM